MNRLNNLGGVEEADLHIRKELEEAGIQVVEGQRAIGGEVPYSLTGKLRGWDIFRRWCYWVAIAPKGGGLPVDIATELHYRQYPTESLSSQNSTSDVYSPKIYGKVVRVNGGSCRPPLEVAVQFDIDGRELRLDPDGSKKAGYKRFLEVDMKDVKRGLLPPPPRFVQSLDGIMVKSVVTGYHIDTQEGLNEFAKVVRSLDARPL